MKLSDEAEAEIVRLILKMYPTTQAQEIEMVRAAMVFGAMHPHLCGITVKSGESVTFTTIEGIEK